MVLTVRKITRKKMAGFSSTQKVETLLIHTIHYLRPEMPYSLSRMTAPNEREAMTQVQRLKALGYTVTEVMPPLTDCRLAMT